MGGLGVCPGGSAASEIFQVLTERRAFCPANAAVHLLISGAKKKRNLNSVPCIVVYGLLADTQPCQRRRRSSIRGHIASHLALPRQNRLFQSARVKRRKWSDDSTIRVCLSYTCPFFVPRIREASRRTIVRLTRSGVRSEDNRRTASPLGARQNLHCSKSSCGADAAAVAETATATEMRATAGRPRVYMA